MGKVMRKTQEYVFGDESITVRDGCWNCKYWSSPNCQKFPRHEKTTYEHWCWQFEEHVDQYGELKDTRDASRWFAYDVKL